jgi:transposase-like protein
LHSPTKPDTRHFELHDIERRNQLLLAQRVRLRTTNILERVNKEVKRRTGVATLFPNDASLLRLVTAVPVELSQEWETGKRYVIFETK